MTLYKQILPAGMLAATALAATLLAACGGSAGPEVVIIDPAARADILLSSERGMESVTLDSKNAYLSFTNTATEGSTVMHTARALAATSTWKAVALGACALPVSEQLETRRAPHLKQVGAKTLLMQAAWGGPDEHTLCELDADKLSFTPKDKDFKVCYPGYCDTMSLDDVQAVGNNWYANAGGAPNLQVSSDQGASWRAVLGNLESMSCYNQSFHLMGERLLVGGECPLDMAYIRAYQMNADKSALASKDALAVGLPDLENRNIQFITSLPNTQRVFAGVEGGLLRSDDGGRNFKFVLQQPLSGGSGNYMYITSLLAPAGKPNTIVVSGWDKAKGLPYLAWSSDNGDKWIDLSSLLPGYKRAAGEATSQVTSMVEDAQGRILLTVNEEHQAKGRLVLVKLGTL